MDIKGLEYVVAVAEHGSFSGAAKSLFVAQPSLSRKIRMIENEFGQRLFIRSSHGVELTSAGQVFFVNAKDILAGCVRLKTSMEQQRRRENCLQLAYTTSNVASVVAVLVRRMRERHPHVNTIVHSDAFIMRCHQISTPVIEPLKKQYCDAVFTFSPVATEAAGNWIKYRTILAGGLSVCVSNEHKFAGRLYVTSNELHDESLLLPPTYFSPMLSGAICEALHEPLNISHCDDPEDFKMEIASGRNVGVVPSAAHSIENESVRCIPVSDVSAGFDLVLAWNEENENPALELFLQICP
ncbi:MAG TPA: LysR family transcriptional regulator [Clostridiaceae bacterium]|nr:LysR family transcriptional regulator [Clostridiaceae bacterium]